MEAAGVSPLYEALALAVAGSEALLRFLSERTEREQQPNLLFAAVRKVCGLVADGAALEAAVAEHGSAIAAVMASHRTQTNEPARTAVLLPALGTLPEPLALIEVGASAGLCLLPDRYAYDYAFDCGAVRLAPEGGGGGVRPPCFPCRAEGDVPLPKRLPHVVWRAGLDLNPLDLGSAATRAWLETLVWPEQEARLARLRQAMAVALADPPRVEAGDLVRDLERLAADAPGEARLVVFHSAVLAYVSDPGERQRFRDCVKATGATWISNEAPGVFPDVAAKLGQGRERPRGHFLLAVDGEPFAWTAPHGQAIAAL